MAWTVELWTSARGDTVLDEVRKDFTPIQMNAIVRGLNRLEKHDGELGPSFFTKPRGKHVGEIREYRITAQNIEIRMLHVLEGSTYIILMIFKHKKGDDVDRRVAAAQTRLASWRAQK